MKRERERGSHLYHINSAVDSPESRNSTKAASVIASLRDPQIRGVRWRQSKSIPFWPEVHCCFANLHTRSSRIFFLIDLWRSIQHFTKRSAQSAVLFKSHDDVGFGKFLRLQQQIDDHSFQESNEKESLPQCSM